MKRFIAFYTTDLTGKLVSALASDSYVPLDARFSLMTAHSVAIKQAERRGVAIGYGRSVDVGPYRDTVTIKRIA